MSRFPTSPATKAVSMTAGQNQADQARIEQATQAFLANGGEIQQVGFQMRNEVPTFTINPERSPVYRHLFLGEAPPKSVEELRSEAAAVMAMAALGHAPGWIAKQLHMTEKRVRQVGRDYHIRFHVQR